MRIQLALALWALLTPQPAAYSLQPSLQPPLAAQSKMPRILSMRQRAEVRDQWTQLRLQRLVPELMRREGIDLWLILCREYNEDPLFRTMSPATWISARRRTVLMFYDPGPAKQVERLAVSRYNVGELFEGVWDPEKEPDQFKRLSQLIAERNPAKIALSRSRTFGLADGLSETEYSALIKALPEEYRRRVVSAERLNVGWLERRIAEEMEVYPAICRIAHRIIAEGLSDQVIQPGVTTTADVQWWYRERIRELKLTTWFHPSVSVQDSRPEEHSGSFSSRPAQQLIRAGDLIHVDFGITYLGLNTDTQQHAYVLRPGESQAPEGLRKALRVGNRLQDILTSQFRIGLTGNQILAAALMQARQEGIEAVIYTHPIGFHGHGAGPAIGMWDKQGGVPGTGDYPLFAETAFSIELNASVPVPEWGGKKVRIMLEEDAFFDGQKVWYIDGRQTDLLLVGK